MSMTDETTRALEGLTRLRQLEGALRLYAQHGGPLVSREDALTLAIDLDDFLQAWNRRAPTLVEGKGVRPEPTPDVTPKSASDRLRKSDGERLCEAFAETFEGGGWADAPAWDDFDKRRQDRWDRTARTFLLDVAVQFDFGEGQP